MCDLHKFSHKYCFPELAFKPHFYINKIHKIKFAHQDFLDMSVIYKGPKFIICSGPMNSLGGPVRDIHYMCRQMEADVCVGHIPDAL